jgi:hypothetical protein
LSRFKNLNAESVGKFKPRVAANLGRKGKEKT